MPRVCGGTQRVSEVGVPVAVAPEDGQVEAAARKLGLERGAQLPVLVVDGGDAAVGAVVDGDLLEALVGDAAAACDVAEVGQDVVLALGAAEPDEEHGVVGDGLGGDDGRQLAGDLGEVVVEVDLDVLAAVGSARAAVRVVMSVVVRVREGKHGQAVPEQVVGAHATSRRIAARRSTLTRRPV